MGSPRHFEGTGCRQTSRMTHPMMQRDHIPENQNIQTQNKSKTFNHDPLQCDAMHQHFFRKIFFPHSMQN
jgi:hypothetical protein